MERSAIALAVILVNGLVASNAAAQEEEPSAPSLDTEGKPTSPPAPVEGIKPRLAGLNVIGGVMFVDFGPMNDRLSDAGYDNDLPSVYPMMGGQAFALFNR